MDGVKKESQEYRKALSKSRNVSLPIKNFDHESSENVTEHFSQTTPIGRTLRDYKHPSSEIIDHQRDVKFRIYMSRFQDDTNLLDIDNGIELNISHGEIANCSSIMTILSKEYGIEYHVFKEAFAIWMVSPLLEVQLKPHHRPYECRKGWEVLLNRFAEKANRFTQDDPILMLRRNVNLTAEREFELFERYPQISRFFLIDALEMMLLGKMLFTDMDDVTDITSSLFYLKYGKFDEAEHDLAFIRTNLEEILPENLCDNIRGTMIFGKPINKKTAHEEKLIDNWRNMKNDEGNKREVEICKKFVQTSSCYGSAWFTASMERKTSKVSVKNFGVGFSEMKVNVGINDRWITIYSSTSNELLLIQKIEQITYKLETSEDDPEDQFLLLNFSEESDSESSGISVDTDETEYFFIIFGNQTPLIEALLASLTKRKLGRTDSEGSSSSSSSSAEHDYLIESRLRSKVCQRVNSKKMCMAKICNRKCTEVAGSLKNIFNHGQLYG